jgi:hypothetical protein
MLLLQCLSLLRPFCDIDSLLKLEKIGCFAVARGRVEVLIKERDLAACTIREHAEGFYTMQRSIGRSRIYTIERINGQEYYFTDNRPL